MEILSIMFVENIIFLELPFTGGIKGGKILLLLSNNHARTVPGRKTEGGDGGVL